MNATVSLECEKLLQGAAVARRQGDRDREQRTLAAVLDLDPNHPVAHNSLGMIALARRDGQTATLHFERACAADPHEPTLWVNLASAARMQGDTGRERAGLERALSLDQRHLIANIRFAELHERERETAAAAARWSAVIALVAPIPDKSPAYQGVLAHAQDFVERYQREFSDVIDQSLAEIRGTVPASDRLRVDACIDAVLGRRRIYLNQPHGLHFPFLPAEEFFAREMFPWLTEFEEQASAIRTELLALIEADMPGLEPYVSMPPGTPDNKWTALDGKLDWGAYFLWKFGERIDSACARCPVTAAIIDKLPLADMPGRAPTAFFSLLKPHTRLPPHTGVTNARAIVHLPLIVPPGCGFRVGGETREWHEGQAFAFDDTIEHEAWNNSNQLRAMLILDVWNPHITPDERTVLRHFFAAANASGLDPGLAGGTGN